MKRNFLLIFGFIALSSSAFAQAIDLEAAKTLLDKSFPTVLKPALKGKKISRNLLQEVFCMNETTQEDEGYGLSPTEKVHYSLDETGGNYVMTLNTENYVDSISAFAPYSITTVVLNSEPPSDDSYFIVADTATVLNWNADLNTYAPTASLYNEVNGFGNIVQSNIYLLVPATLLFQQTNYYYNSSQQLIGESNYGINFSTFEFEFEDSIAYQVDATGKILSSKTYILDNIPSLTLDEQGAYYYSGSNLDSIVTYDESGDLDEKETFTYDAEGRVIVDLTEWITDAGWVPNDKFSYTYSGLAYGFAATETSEYFNGTSWSTYTNIEREACNPDGLTEVNTIDFQAYISGQDIMLQGIDGAVSIVVLDIDGHTIFRKDYKYAPNQISTQNLSSGMYFVQVIQNNAVGVQKIIKI